MQKSVIRLKVLFFNTEVTAVYEVTYDDPQLWHVIYEDGDEEDLDVEEMECDHQLYLGRNVHVDNDISDSSYSSSHSDDEFDPFI